MSSDRAELERSAELDRMLEELDRELIAAERTEAARLLVNVTDQRSPRRSRRRAGRSVLRSLPVRLSPSELGESEAA
jgi:parvulin-like peptidyl-prolyl isomerase